MKSDDLMLYAAIGAAVLLSPSIIPVARTANRVVSGSAKAVDWYLDNAWPPTAIPHPNKGPAINPNANIMRPNSWFGSDDTRFWT